MSVKTVFILHKQGAPSHYVALEALLSEHGIAVKYREFSIFTKLFKSLLTLDTKLFAKQLKNSFFILQLLTSKNKKVLLGIAPFDRKLVKISSYLKKHRVYYHTSWTVWDKTFHPNTKKNTEAVFQRWRHFLEEKAEHIFAVSETSKKGLLTNYHISEEKISVVKHALAPDFIEIADIPKKQNSFIYYGRLLPEKGLSEMLDYFSKKKKASLTIIGSGKEADVVQSFSKRFNNIHFQEFVNDKSTLREIIASHQYLILNSKKTKKWEELFGLVIIESMSQGLIPIASAHSGPKEIIEEDFGFLFKENELPETLDRVLSGSHDTETMGQKAIENSRNYTVESIKKRWKAILNQ